MIKTTKASKTIRANNRKAKTEGEASPSAGTGDWIAYPALHDDRPVNWRAVGFYRPRTNDVVSRLTIGALRGDAG